MEYKNEPLINHSCGRPCYSSSYKACHILELAKDWLIKYPNGLAVYLALDNLKLEMVFCGWLEIPNPAYVYGKIGKLNGTIRLAS